MPQNNYNQSQQEFKQFREKLDQSFNYRRANLEKHGLSFEDVPLVFEGECVTFEDNRLVYGEMRYITLGKLKGRVVVIVHTPRPDRTRIISMRKANNREQKIYQKRLGEN